jgi:cyclohexa-1,5-dienecarbonyl-CoA hydratase
MFLDAIMRRIVVVDCTKLIEIIDQKEGPPMLGSDSKFVRYKISDGVGKMILDRPPVNIINIPMLKGMETSLQGAMDDPDLKVLIIQAEGKFFSAGVDVADHTSELVTEMIPLFDRVCKSVVEFPVPTIAAVSGHALGGGCEIVICCDFAFMVKGARIGQPEIQLASMAPVAALRLPLLVGARWAARILFTGEQIEATNAVEIGLIDKAVPPDRLESEVSLLTGKLSQLSAAALRVNKKGYLLGLSGWDRKITEMEGLYLDELMQTEDAHEGLQAFMDKRKPVWKNR